MPNLNNKLNKRSSEVYKRLKLIKTIIDMESNKDLEVEFLKLLDNIREMFFMEESLLYEGKYNIYNHSHIMDHVGLLTEIWEIIDYINNNEIISYSVINDMYYRFMINYTQKHIIDFDSKLRRSNE